MEIIERTYRSQESHFEFEERIFHKDGSIRYLLTNGAFSHSRKGVPTLNCVIIDITKRRLSEQELAINEERFRIAVTQTQSVIFDYHIQKNKWSIRKKQCTSMDCRKSWMMFRKVLCVLRSFLANMLPLFFPCTEKSSKEVLTAAAP